MSEASGRKTVKSVLKILNRELRFNKATPVFIVSLALFASAVIPLLVTIDGIVYIANAKSILTPDFAKIYTFYREPIYPLLLKSIHFWGDAGVLIVFVQSLLLGSAALFAYYSLIRLIPNFISKLWHFLLLWVMLINPMFLGYSGAVLQQSLFTFQLAVFGFFLSLAMNKPAFFKSWAIGIVTLVWYIFSVLTSIGWIYLALLPVTATIGFLFIPYAFKLIRKFPLTTFIRAVVSVICILAALLFCYQIGKSTYESWDRYKRPFISENSGSAYVIKPLSSVPYIPTPWEISIRTLSLMNVIVLEPYEKENDLFMSIQMRRQTPSSSWDSAWNVEPQASYAVNYFKITNPGELLHNGYARLAAIAPFLYQATMIFTWVFAIFAGLTKRWKSLFFFVLVPLNFLLVYAASNSPIDRYGIPVYVFGATSLICFIEIIIRKAAKK